VYRVYHTVRGIYYPVVLGCTVPLCKSKVYISGPCLILVLTTILGRPRRTDAKNDVKIIMGRLLPEKM
jgi:hypothetical protein